LLSHSLPLDGLRGLAILLVMAHHLSVAKSDLPFDAAALDLLRTGWIGVNLFFVLSGFLITGILIDARDSDRYFVSFYARRTLRIVPLYYLIVLISYHVLPHFPVWYERLVVARGETIPHEGYFWLFLTNFVFAAHDRFEHGILLVAWSLAIEEQFYLLWAVVVWICPPRRLGLLCVCILIGTPLLRGIALANGASLVDIMVGTPYQGDALAAGAWLAWRSRRPAPEAVSRVAPWALPVGLAGIAGMLWWEHPLGWDSRVLRTIGYSCIALIATGLIVCATTMPQRSWWVRAFSWSWLCSIGKYSYCLYLVHLPVMWTMKYAVFDPVAAPRLFGSAMPAQALFWVIAFAPAFAIAWLSWRYFEQPILRLKRFFPY
jgi:peptidoglycan/LPS O-acetylase OafA/YrhL